MSDDIDHELYNKALDLVGRILERTAAEEQKAVVITDAMRRNALDQMLQNNTPVTAIIKIMELLLGSHDSILEIAREPSEDPKPRPPKNLDS